MNSYMDKEYLKQNLMGPNALKMLEDALNTVRPDSARRILDLGCGTGLTSMYLADQTDAQVFALDLWISAAENYERFREFGFEKRIIPIHADATSATFADEYFDAVFSIDSYHYFGRDEKFMDRCLAPLVKKDGLIIICVPGLKHELNNGLPYEMALSWKAEDIETIISIDRWRAILEKSELIETCSITEMPRFEEYWNDWLECNNPYAISDRAAMNGGAGKYMNLIQIICKKK